LEISASRWSRFGGMQNTSVCNPSFWVWSSNKVQLPEQLDAIHIFVHSVGAIYSSGVIYRIIENCLLLTHGNESYIVYSAIQWRRLKDWTNNAKM